MKRYFQAGSSRPASGSCPGLWMIRVHRGRRAGRGQEAVREGRDPAPSSIKADCGQLGPRLSTERRGLFHCRPLDMEGAAESRSATSSSQNRVVGAGSTRDPLQSQRPASALGLTCGPGEARPRSHSGSSSYSSSWRQRKEL